MARLKYYHEQSVILSSVKILIFQSRQLCRLKRIFERRPQKIPDRILSSLLANVLYLNKLSKCRLLVSMEKTENEASHYVFWATCGRTLLWSKNGFLWLITFVTQIYVYHVWQYTSHVIFFSCGKDYICCRPPVAEHKHFLGLTFVLVKIIYIFFYI